MGQRQSSANTIEMGMVFWANSNAMPPLLFETVHGNVIAMNNDKDLHV